jgi:hypothetical protein
MLAHPTLIVALHSSTPYIFRLLWGLFHHVATKEQSAIDRLVSEWHINASLLATWLTGHNELTPTNNKHTFKA